MDLLRKMFPNAWRPAQVPNRYPFDLDGSERFCRFGAGIDYFPFVGGDGTVPQIGAVDGLMRQFDVQVWNQMTGRVPTGPGSTTVPLNLQWQMTIPGLGKAL